ncbi:hypothetical protein COLO4_28152 [Corchorus olitorius]|uniref:Uncharacterized protein n=1 Tax=Corchorus olitorius TaxID=93759 RepID=A0A1R3HMN9_9ROSI|nr:hypothetical protein COLO4_28152 [Corchorus olitorius]
MNGNPVRQQPILQGRSGNTGQRGMGENVLEGNSVEITRKGILRRMGTNSHEKSLGGGGWRESGRWRWRMMWRVLTIPLFLMSLFLLFQTRAGLQTSLQRGNAKKAISSGPSRIKNNIATEESVESYDPDSPFVFGAGVSDGRKN